MNFNDRVDFFFFTETSKNLRRKMSKVSMYRQRLMNWSAFSPWGRRLENFGIICLHLHPHPHTLF